MGLFKTPKLQAPTPTPAPGISVNQSGAQQAAAAGNAAKLAGGFGSTILTSPQGVGTGQSSQSQTGVKTLMGG